MLQLALLSDLVVDDFLRIETFPFHAVGLSFMGLAIRGQYLDWRSLRAGGRPGLLFSLGLEGLLLLSSNRGELIRFSLFELDQFLDVLGVLLPGADNFA